MSALVSRRTWLKQSAFVSGWALVLRPAAAFAIGTHIVPVLLDDLVPQPIAGTGEWYYSRLDADRGRINAPLVDLIRSRGQVS